MSGASDMSSQPIPQLPDESYEVTHPHTGHKFSSRKYTNALPPLHDVTGFTDKELEQTVFQEGLLVKQVCSYQNIGHIQFLVSDSH